MKYKANHLLFLHDFKEHYSNNMSEKDLRICKNRDKMAGGQKCIRQGNVLQDHELYRNSKAPWSEYLPKYHSSNERQTSYTITDLFATP